MISVKALDLIEKNEGYRQFTYDCSAGKKTIGIGFNLDDVGLSLEESQVILGMRLNKIDSILDSSINIYHALNDERQAALCDMAYQMGVKGLLSFKRSIELLEKEEWNAAANEMLNSRWAKQTPNRAIRITNIIRTGEW